uniref:latexin n=1 Tax=Monopterus albus TaxID=43700 RepID=UPI0009B4C32A|nr:latexin [Monopterus albus]
MGLMIIAVLAVLTGVTGSPGTTVRPEGASADMPAGSPGTTVRPEGASAEMPAHPNSVLQVANNTELSAQGSIIWKGETGRKVAKGDLVKVSAVEKAEEEVMATGELNPSHYPARRAAQVIQHHLNTHYGSPYRLFMLHKVHRGYAEDVADSGRKYQLDVSVEELLSNTTEKVSAEVFFPRGQNQSSPQVQASCEELLKISTKEQEEALYQKYKTNQSLLSTQHLPDSHGHMEPDMKPFWHLGIIASSYIMLNESTENTLYNMAQVANVTQLATENDQLKFEYQILLHDVVSQEIIRWKLLFTWTPSEGVKVLQTEKLPRCHCKQPLNIN